MECNREYRNRFTHKWSMTFKIPNHLKGKKIFLASTDHNNLYKKLLFMYSISMWNMKNIGFPSRHTQN